MLSLDVDAFTDAFDVIFGDVEQGDRDKYEVADAYIRVLESYGVHHWIGFAGGYFAGGYGESC